MDTTLFLCHKTFLITLKMCHMSYVKTIRYDFSLELILENECTYYIYNKAIILMNYDVDSICRITV